MWFRHARGTLWFNMISINAKNVTSLIVKLFWTKCVISWAHLLCYAFEVAKVHTMPICIDEPLAGERTSIKVNIGIVFPFKRSCWWFIKSTFRILFCSLFLGDVLWFFDHSIFAMFCSRVHFQLYLCVIVKTSVTNNVLQSIICFLTQQKIKPNEN